MTTDSLRNVKDRFSEFVDRVESEHERIVVTRNGRPAAVLISPDDLESLEETLDLLSDQTAIRELVDAQAAVAAGDVVRGVDAVRSLRPASAKWMTRYMTSSSLVQRRAQSATFFQKTLLWPFSISSLVPLLKTLTVSAGSSAENLPASLVHDEEHTESCIESMTWLEPWRCCGSTTEAMCIAHVKASILCQVTAPKLAGFVFTTCA
jgi:antitoxin YefM